MIVMLYYKATSKNEEYRKYSPHSNPGLQSSILTETPGREQTLNVGLLGKFVETRNAHTPKRYVQAIDCDT